MRGWQFLRTAFKQHLVQTYRLEIAGELTRFGWSTRREFDSLVKASLDAKMHLASTRQVLHYGTKLGANYQGISGSADVRFNDWGPYDYHRDFNLTCRFSCSGSFLGVETIAPGLPRTRLASVASTVSWMLFRRLQTLRKAASVWRPRFKHSWSSL